MANRKLLTRAEAAQRLGVSLRTIGNMIRSNQANANRGLKSVKIGRLRKIPERAVADIETARKRRVIF